MSPVATRPHLFSQPSCKLNYLFSCPLGNVTKTLWAVWTIVCHRCRSPYGSAVSPQYWRVAGRKNAPATHVRSNKSLAASTSLQRFCSSLACTINLSPSVSESSPKGNDSELSDKTGGGKSGVSRCKCAYWLATRGLSLISRRLLIIACNLFLNRNQPGRGSKTRMSDKPHILPFLIISAPVTVKIPGTNCGLSLYAFN